MKTLFTIFPLLLLATVFLSHQEDNKVTLDIIDTSGKVTAISFDWPFTGPPPVGAGDSVIAKKVRKILADNNIDCPPRREKITDNIWLCGNGKKVRPKEAKLVRLLSEAWKNN